MTLFQRSLKRAFDLSFTLIATGSLLPIAFIVSLLILLDSRGPIFYRATRVGKNGRRFTLYKFRTMIRNAHTLGPPVTCGADPRITRIGRILRKTKFDEFPQVINVLRGQMSIVGPRPEAAEYVALYSPEQRQILQMRPGFTSLAQVGYRDEEKLLPHQDTADFYINEVLPHKLELDLYYVEKWSLILDFKVFLIGLVALFRVPAPSLLRFFSLLKEG